MASTRQFRKKIRSAKNIAKITRAMQMVAASKMKKAQEQAEQGRDYANGLSELSNILSGQFDTALHPLLTENTDAKLKLYVILSPDKGLCGSLVSNLNKKVLSFPELKNAEFVVVGKKGVQTIKKVGGEVVAEFNIGISRPSYEIVPTIAKVITDRYLTGTVKEVEFIYTEFINTMSQLATSRILLPLQVSFTESEGTVGTQPKFIFEPTPTDIIKSLLNRYLEVEIYQLLLESYASEQSARMVAMKNATDNAQGLISDLTIQYNKARQASITSEIIDISGATNLVQ